MKPRVIENVLIYFYQASSDETFQSLVLDDRNGECPACYFRPFKRMLKSATKAGYFRTSPAGDAMSKEKKNVPSQADH